MSETVLSYELLSTFPVEPGWRALYVTEDTGDTLELALLAWGNYQVTAHAEDGTTQDEGRRVEGVVAYPMRGGGVTYVGCAAYADNFWYYLPPHVLAPELGTDPEQRRAPQRSAPDPRTLGRRSEATPKGT